MIDTVSLKSAIIDLAVTGQLSSQFHITDSVADIIAALPPLSNKRKRLIGQSFDYGKQATLPNHWKWIRLGELSSYGDTPKKVNFNDVSGDTWILDLEDIQSGGRIIKKTRVNDKKFIGDKTVFFKSQVLYSKLRPYLKKVLVADEDGISTPELISFDVFGGISPQYIMYCLLSSFTDRAIEKRSYGIKMPRVDAGFMVNLPIPVPPLSEQHFIVERIQLAFLQIDTIDELQAQYADNLTALKSKLIDAAIRGKLTEQLPEDGTAEELYQQIQEEKQKLIKEGKIKKQKPLPEITDEEIPFDIPKNWKWIRLNEIGVYSGGKTPSMAIDDYWKNGSILWVTSKDMKRKYISSTGMRITEKASQELTVYPKGTIIFVVRSGILRRLFPVAILETNGTINQDLKALQLYLPQMCEYVYYMLKGLEPTILFKYTKDGTTVNNIIFNELLAMTIPLPPLAEQKRIVQKLDEILPLCETQK